jgi:hypothetical protein
MFAEDQPYVKLLFFLIKHEFFELGPLNEILSPITIEQPKYYRNYAVAALVYKCNHSKERTIRSLLAAAILMKLVEKRERYTATGKPTTYRSLLDAGASLLFLRYHLGAPEEYFYKDARLNCTAKDLYENEFDLLLCLRAGFDTDELMVAGFDEASLMDETVLQRDNAGCCFSEIEHLERLKKSNFKRFLYLGFTFEELLATKVFTKTELLEYSSVFILPDDALTPTMTHRSYRISRNDAQSFRVTPL